MIDAWWLPPPISRHAIAHDAQFVRTFTATALIFIMAQCALARDRVEIPRLRPEACRQTATSDGKRLELFWTGGHDGPIPRPARSWEPRPGRASSSRQRRADAEPVEVLARQFAWNFRYPGPDKRFGRTDISLINEAAGNPFGLDDADPASRDDIVSATLRVPAGKPVNLDAAITRRDS